MFTPRFNHLSFIVLGAFALYSCKSKTPSKAETVDSTKEQTVSSKTSDVSSSTTISDTLDLKSIPVTDKLTGTFPYFKLPSGYHFFENPQSSLGYGEVKDFDKEYLINHGVYFSQEGKTFKCGIGADQNKTFSELELQKSFDDFVASIGGVKLYGGEGFRQGEYERMNKIDPDFVNSPYKFSISDIIEGKWLHTYAIHTPNKLVFIQISIHNNDAALTVLETKPFENTMEQTSAAVIKEDIEQKGKSILHINFEVDKSTLLPEGEVSVNEILKVLQSEPNLKLSINGYTDNSGNAAHNKQLSTERADKVKSTLINLGIAPFRLKATGFGAENPLLHNTTDENKAQNRRVELVKI